MQVNMYEAKTNLAKYIKMLDQEKEIVLAKNGIPVARIVKYEEPKERVLGALKGAFTVPEDINAGNEEVAELFGV